MVRAGAGSIIAMILLAISGAPVVAEADAGAASSSLIPATHLSGPCAWCRERVPLPLQLSMPVGAETSSDAPTRDDVPGGTSVLAERPTSRFR